MRAGRHGNRSVFCWTVAIASLWGGAPGHAQEAPSDDSARVLVLVLPVDAADADTAESLTELLIGAVASSNRATSIVGKEEFQAQLQQDDRASLECVGSPACLGRVGVQLGVAEVLAATLARREGVWVFDLHRLDPRSGDSVGHAYREVAGDLGALADALHAALATLDEPVIEPATLRIAADVPGAEVSVDGLVLGRYRDTPVEAPGLQPGEHEVTVRADGYRPWSREVTLESGDVVRIEAGLTRDSTALAVPDPPPPTLLPPAPQRRWSPVLWVGLGLTVVSGALALGFGISSRREPEAGVNRAEALAFVDDRRRDARLSNASLGIALGGLGIAGLGLWLSDLRGERAGSLGLAPRRGGLAVDWRARW